MNSLLLSSPSGLYIISLTLIAEERNGSSKKITVNIMMKNFFFPMQKTSEESFICLSQKKGAFFRQNRRISGFSLKISGQLLNQPEDFRNFRKGVFIPSQSSSLLHTPAISSLQ